MTVKIYIEIPFFLLFFSFIFSGSIKGNLIIYRTCYTLLGYNKSECGLLGSQNPDNTTADLEKVVEPYAAVVNTAHSVLEGVSSSVICLFVGPWSDKFGRKPALIVPIIGFITHYIFYTLFAFLDVSPWFSLICSIPICLTGGTSTYFAVLLCYLTEISSQRSRGMRMSLFEAIITLGIMVGQLSSSYLLMATNYPSAFIIAALSCLLSLILTVLFVPESLMNPETEGKFSKFFQWTHIVEMVRTTFRKRENYDRYVFLMCLVVTTISLVVGNGDGSVQTLFLRGKFQFSLRDCNFFSAAISLNGIIGAIVGVYLLHMVVKIPESTMMIIGFVSTFAGSMFMGFAKYRWEIYVAAFTRALGGVINPMARTLVSKIIPYEEIGNIFSLIIVFESMIALTGSPMYTAIYNATISTDPGIYNFVSAGIYLVEILLAICIIVVPRTQMRYRELGDNTSSEA